MTRIKSATTYQGSPRRDTGVDSPILTRWLYNVAGDLAAAYDRLTGENSETETVNHSGGGRGALLNLPLIAQHVEKSIWQPNAASKYSGRTFILLAPVQIPDGQTTYSLAVDIKFRGAEPGDMNLEVHSYDGAWTLTRWPYTVGEERDIGATSSVSTLRATMTLSAGAGATDAYVGVSCLLEDQELDGIVVIGWRLNPDVGSNAARTRNDWSTATSSDLPDSFPVATTIDLVTGFDEEQIADDRGLDSLVLTSATSWLHALMEYVMGGALPGNGSRTITDEWRNNQARFTSEPTPAVPIFSECLGGILEAGDSVCASTSGTGSENGSWAAPMVTANATTVNVAAKVAYLPDLKSSSPNKLRARVLVASTAGSIETTWAAAVDTAAGTSSGAAFVALGGNFFIAEISNIPFTAGALNRLTLQITSDASAAFDECNVVGWTVYFEE